ncbi:MAG: hypothetical protein IJY75_00145 [Bacteroidaceae bacterium]|nr:hypothetical protein [Bacteroidaceae bacterium]
MKAKILTYSVFIAMTLLLVFSAMVMPMTPEHGYYTALAKYMAEGLVPYNDFYTMDTPVGIGIYSLLYRVAGVGASTYLSNVLIVFANLMNMLLMAKLMRRLKVSSIFIPAGVLFYFVMCYSSDALHMNMESIAMTFMLSACLLMMKRKKLYCIVSALLIALAVGCKAQCMVMLPATLLFVAIKGKKNKIDIENSILLMACAIAFAFAGYTAIALISNNPDWWENIKWSIEKHPYYNEISCREELTYLVIQSARCGLIFFLLLPFVWKKMSHYGRRCAVIGIVATMCYFTLFIFGVEVSHGMFLYPFVVLSLMHMMQAINKRWVAATLSIILLSVPTALCIRELLKFGNGAARNEIDEELAIVKDIMQKPGKAVMLIDSELEYYVGPQIFSECPHVKPVVIGNGSLGFRNSYKESDYFVANMHEADYIIINDQAFSGLMLRKERHVIGDKIENMNCIGTQSIIIYEK